MTDGFWGAKSAGRGARMINAAVQHIIGTDPTVINNLNVNRMLVMRCDFAAFRFKVGRQLAQDFTTTFAANTATISAHGLITGDGPYHLFTSTTLPDPLAVDTDVFVIRVDANTLKLALSREKADAGDFIVLTDDGTGTHTLGEEAALIQPAAASSLGEGWIMLNINEEVVMAAPRAVTVIGFGTTPVLTWYQPG